MKHTFTIPICPITDQINAKVYHTARSKSSSAEGEAVIADLNEEENSDMIDASLDKAIQRLGSIIGIYAPNSVTRTQEGEEPFIRIEMTMPSNFDTTALPVLQDAIARYCEGVVMQDWTSITVPSEVEHYTQHQVAAIADIRRSLMQRTRPQYEDDAVRIEDSIEVIYPNE